MSDTKLVRMIMGAVGNAATEVRTRYGSTGTDEANLISDAFEMFTDELNKATRDLISDLDYDAHGDDL